MVAIKKILLRLSPGTRDRSCDAIVRNLAAEPTLVAFPLSLVPGSYDLVTNQNIQHGGTFGVKKILNLAQGDFTVR